MEEDIFEQSLLNLYYNFLAYYGFSNKIEVSRLIVNKTVKCLEKILNDMFSSETNLSTRSSQLLSVCQDLRVLLVNPLIDILNSIPNNPENLEWKTYLSSIITSLKDDRLYAIKVDKSGGI